MSTAQDDMNDKLRNHGLPVPKQAETAEPMSAEERAQKLTRICLDYWELDDPEFEDNYALDIAEQIRQAEQAARAHERRKALEEAATQCSIQGLIDNQERKNAIVDARSWNAAVVKCRDTLRALANSSEPGEDT